MLTYLCVYTKLYASRYKFAYVLGLHKNTLKFNDMVERLKELRKAVLLMVIF